MITSIVSVVLVVLEILVSQLPFSIEATVILSETYSISSRRPTKKCLHSLKLLHARVVSLAAVVVAAWARAVVVVEPWATGTSENNPADSVAEDMAADTAVVVPDIAMATAEAATAAGGMGLEEWVETMELPSTVVEAAMVLPPAVGGRYTFTMPMEGRLHILHLPVFATAIAHCFGHLFANLLFQNLSPSYICQYFFSLSRLFVMVFYCNRQIVASQRQHQAGLDYCTAKISVEHGMGGFRRFLQGVSSWVY
jgi:hypothetical protein